MAKAAWYIHYRRQNFENLAFPNSVC